MPLVTPTMKTNAACTKAKMVRNLTKYSMSAFRVLDDLPTPPLNNYESKFVLLNAGRNKLMDVSCKNILFSTYVSSTMVPMRVASPVRITTAKHPPSTTENGDEI